MSDPSPPVPPEAAAAPWRLAVHGRYGADPGYALEGASNRGVYLQRLAGSSSHYAEYDALWLCWSDAERIRLQVLARVRHCDPSGLRLQFEPGQPVELIAQIQQLLPRRSLGDGGGPTADERAVAMIVDAIRSDFVAACRRLLGSVHAGIADGDPEVAIGAGLTPAAAMHQLQTQGSTIEDEFRRRLTQPWRQSAGADATLRHSTSALQLMGDGEMRAWLLGREASRALGRACESSWRPLRAQLEALLRGRSGVNVDELAATAVVDALAQSLHAGKLDPALQDRILQAFGQQREFDLGALYEGLALALRRARIVPEAQSDPTGTAVHPAAGAPQAPAAIAAPEAAGVSAPVYPAIAGSVPEPPRTAPTPPDTATAWSALRRIGAPADANIADGVVAGGGAIADSVLLRVAGELLGGRAETTASGFRTRLEQRARQLAGDPAAPLERRQHDAVDLVARIHQALDEDPLLPAGFRERCRPLLRPILATELQGDGIGAAGEPLRRLLSLVEFGSALAASRQDATISRVRDALDEELAGLARTLPWSASQVEAACERLEQLLQRHRAASQASEKRVVETCAGQQKLADGRLQVQRELAALFAGRTLPQALVELLAGQLSSTLLPILLRAGVAAPAWKQQLARLEQLHVALRKAAAGLPAADADAHLQWLRHDCARTPEDPALTRCIDSLGAALNGEAVPWVAFADGSSATAAVPDVALATAATEPDALEEGGWLSFAAPGQEPRLAKLVWRAADRSRYVFVNRLGQKSDDLDAPALQAALAEGRVRIVEKGDADLAERAWRRMLVGRHDDLAVQATRDALTGLLDRREMERRLQAWLVAPERATMLLLWFGVDHLRLVNQTHGMAVGDHLLCEVSATLQRYLDAGHAPAGFAARAAGDEFVVVLEGLPMAEAERRAVALFDQANALEIEVDGVHHRLSLSMGMVPADAANVSIERLLADAERACEAAKESGRGRWYRHQSDDALLSQMRQSAHWVRRIDESLQSRGLELYGQRAAWLGSGTSAQPDYIEILLRMQTAEGMAMPGDFILAAERYGQIAAVDRFVLQELTRVLQRIGSSCKALVAFNISARNIIDPAFVDEIVETLRQQPLPLQQLCVELTETAAIQQIDEAAVGMRKLSDAGLSMVLDDFGSGWSSYQYLRRLPFDLVKVDGSFIRDIAHAAEDRALASSINEIAHLLGKRTVAEHVEDQATLDQVRAIGFDYAQGYLIGRPVPISGLLGIA